MNCAGAIWPFILWCCGWSVRPTN